MWKLCVVCIVKGRTDKERKDERFQNLKDNITK
jgi:hypothetical protein